MTAHDPPCQCTLCIAAASASTASSSRCRLGRWFFVGAVIGMERAVLPTLAHELGVKPDAFLFLTSFVLSFGPVKGALNFVAGSLADHIGRKPVLLVRWVICVPIPPLIYFAPNWW